MPLRKFSEIVKLAEKHHGKAGLAKRLAENAKKPVVKKQSDDRYLAAMSQAVFSAGFSWDVIEKKWPGFEEAFDHFDPHKVAFYADREVARLLKDTRIVRNGAKIQATINNAQFVTLVYNNVLGRAPDAFGLSYWVGQLDGGLMTRGQVMVGFSESPEYQQRSYNRVFVTMVYYGMLRRVPEQAGFDYWVGQLNAGTSALNLINGFLAATEYRGRFLP